MVTVVFRASVLACAYLSSSVFAQTSSRETLAPSEGHDAAQNEQSANAVPLTVGAGTPLRLYLTKRISKRAGEPVEAKLLDPLYSFDREVVPAGSQVFGVVAHVKPVTRMERTLAILGGDFTPLHEADVEFSSLVLPDGRSVVLNTVETPGLNSLANLNAKKQPASANRNSGVMGTAKAQVQNKVTQTRQKVLDLVRGPGKKERLEDFLWAKLPYHPQYVRRLTRFDAELAEPLQFGSAMVKSDELRLVGSQPQADNSVQAWLATSLNSSWSKQGERVEAVISRPLLSPDHKLLLPEGTRLIGEVTMVQRARWFHRGGQLPFNFQRVALPQGIDRPSESEGKTTFKTLAILDGAEPDRKTTLKVDEEGGVKATEPKTRFVAPLVFGFT